MLSALSTDMPKIRKYLDYERGLLERVLANDLLVLENRIKKARADLCNDAPIDPLLTRNANSIIEHIAQWNLVLDLKQHLEKGD